MTPRLTRSLTAAAGLLTIVAAVAPGAAQAAEPKFTCEASALRATVLGQPIEPAVYGRGQDCKTGSSTPTVSVPALLDASVLFARGTKTEDPLKPAANATGGLTGLKVKLLPSLPIALPNADAAINAIPDIVIPTAGVSVLPVPGLPTEVKVSVRDLVKAALPNGQLPNVDLLSAGVLSSVAGASCSDGKLSLAGASTVTGLKVLGQDVNLDGTLQKNLNVIDTSNFDPSNITVAQVQDQFPDVLKALLPLPGVTVTLQAALQPLLDAIPTISIPATSAQVRVTAGGQTKTDTTITQQALRVEVSLSGRSILDAVVGESKASATGPCPGGQPDELACPGGASKASATGPCPAAAQPAELGCTERKLVLVDVFQQGSKGIKLKGAANKDFAGKTVSIRFGTSKKVVATAKVEANGGFSTYAKTPPKSIRNTNQARYTAVRGNEESLPLKLTRRMRVSRVVNGTENVTITGFVRKPLAAPAQTISLRRRVQCGKQKVIATTKPNKDGRYTFVVPATDKPAVYRATTRVRKNVSNKKTYPTFTLPRGVDLLER